MGPHRDRHHLLIRLLRVRGGLRELASVNVCYSIVIQASLASRCLPAAKLAPPAPRPKTTAAVAVRLISGALGGKPLRDRAGEAKLAAARQEKAAARRQKETALAEAWGDDQE